jgi:hypothetical protein
VSLELGPLGYVLWVVRYLIPLAALAVTIDALRRPPADFWASWWRWLWVVPQAVLVLVTLAGYGVPGAPAILGGLAIALVIVCVPMQIGYLFAVVLSSHERTAGSLEEPAVEEPPHA